MNPMPPPNAAWHGNFPNLIGRPRRHPGIAAGSFEHLNDIASSDPWVDGYLAWCIAFYAMTFQPSLLPLFNTFDGLGGFRSSVWKDLHLHRHVPITVAVGRILAHRQQQTTAPGVQAATSVVGTVPAGAAALAPVSSRTSSSSADTSASLQQTSVAGSQSGAHVMQLISAKRPFFDFESGSSSDSWSSSEADATYEPGPSHLPPRKVKKVGSDHRYSWSSSEADATYEPGPSHLPLRKVKKVGSAQRARSPRKRDLSPHKFWYYEEVDE